MAPKAAIKCPTCGMLVELPMTAVANDLRQGVAVVSLETGAFLMHAKACGAASPSTAVAVPDRPQYVTPGNRFCVGCGVTSPDCMRGLESEGRACCSLCGEGDTHPVPEARAG